MPMITITDDHNRKIMLTIDEKCIISADYHNLDENGEKRTEWHLTIEVPHQGCSALFFNSTNSMQKVWNRLCEITGAKDIFELPKKNLGLCEDCYAFGRGCELDENGNCQEKTGWRPKLNQICFGCKKEFDLNELNYIPDNYYCEQCYLKEIPKYRSNS